MFNIIKISEQYLQDMLYTHYLTTVIAFLAGIISGIICVWVGIVIYKIVDRKLTGEVGK